MRLVEEGLLRSQEVGYHGWKKRDERWWEEGQNEVMVWSLHWKAFVYESQRLQGGENVEVNR
jgi:hypothetical protein